MTKKAEIVKQEAAIQPYALQKSILTTDESNSLISNGGSQIVIPSGYNFGGTNPYAFTEQGVAMQVAF